MHPTSTDKSQNLQFSHSFFLTISVVTKLSYKAQIFWNNLNWDKSHNLRNQYHGLVTTFYIHCVLLIDDDIWWCMYFSSPLSQMCYFFSFFIHIFPLVYNLSMFHTWCLNESCLSVLVKTSCKSSMPWSLFL